MPIYEYRCTDCGLQREFLQKIADAPIAACPACGSSGFSKMLSAAGFHLKGSGWYATDFKSGSKSGGKESTESKSDESAASATPCGGSCTCH
jgi:putative FmdB family regulatory protein